MMRAPTDAASSTARRDERSPGGRREHVAPEPALRAAAGDDELGRVRGEQLEAAGDVERDRLDDSARQLARGAVAVVRPANAAWASGCHQGARAPCSQGSATHAAGTGRRRGGLGQQHLGRPAGDALQPLERGAARRRDRPRRGTPPAHPSTPPRRSGARRSGRGGGPRRSRSCPTRPSAPASCAPVPSTSHARSPPPSTTCTPGGQAEVVRSVDRGPPRDRDDGRGADAPPGASPRSSSVDAERAVEPVHAGARRERLVGDDLAGQPGDDEVARRQQPACRSNVSGSWSVTHATLAAQHAALSDDAGRGRGTRPGHRSAAPRRRRAGRTRGSRARSARGRRRTARTSRVPRRTRSRATSA